MTVSPERDGVGRDDEAGSAVDRIEGGTLVRPGADFRGIAPATVLIGAIVVVLIGLFLGWYLFHARGHDGQGTVGHRRHGGYDAAARGNIRSPGARGASWRAN